MWINHHTVFKQIDRVDRTFLMINVLFLMVIAFVPFPTRVLAAHLHHDARTAAITYGLATASALISSWLSVSLYGDIAAFYVLESSLFGRN